MAVQTGYKLKFVFVELFGSIIAQGLHSLYHNDQDYDGGQHNVHLEALLAVADSKVAQAAAAQGAGHGGITD